MRAVKLADRDLMCHEVAESFARIPDVKMKCGRLDLEREFAQPCEVEVDSMIWRRTYRAKTAGEHRQGRAMDMPAGDELDARVTPDNRGKLASVMEVVLIHVPDPRNEGRMVQE